jgi:methionyl-tRNA formyltransferase
VKEIKSYSPGGFDFAVVASYGKIIPQNILDIPRLGMLNVHPSLLPKLRGASPIQSAILTENETGVTIMRVDAEMDHGPIVAQAKLNLKDSVVPSDEVGFGKKVEVPDWPPYENDLEDLLGRQGGQLLAKILPDWLAGKISETEQDHTAATFCKKIEKEDGLLNLEDDPETNLRKIRAYHVWPGAYFFTERNELCRFSKGLALNTF